MIQDDYNSIYIKSNSKNSINGTIFASTSNYEKGLYATYMGGLGLPRLIMDSGIRPIVCLKSDTELEKTEDGSLWIKDDLIDAKDISNVPASYYGAEVKGYTCESDGVSKWRIYYADENNIYLISDDYIEKSDAPNGKNGSEITTTNKKYQLSLDNVENDYPEGASWITNSSKASKWLSYLLSKYGDNTYSSMKKTAYLLDTDVWKEFAGENAEFAIGAPTLELFCASYEGTHPDRYLRTRENNSFGYCLEWNDSDIVGLALVEDLDIDGYNSIYFKSDTSRAEAMYIASPWYGNQGSLPMATNDGTLENSGGKTGLRPIVCLKADTRLEKLSDGSFRIKKYSLGATDISTLASEYYGREIKGYEYGNNDVNIWRIFYADKSNIYMIADDYISYENAPEGKNGSKVTRNDNDYRVSFNDIINDYPEGASWISNNSKASKWQSQFLNSYGTSTNINIKAVSYLMDTEAWSIYAGNKAEYAIGSPTLEMLVASYKDTHPNKYIECGNITTNGYFVKWSSEQYTDHISGATLDDYNSIYFKSDNSKNDGMWVASPSEISPNNLMDTDYMGNIYYAEHTYNGLGLRPIVCLKSDVKVQEQKDGSLLIIK